MGFVLLVYMISLACVLLWVVALPLIFLYYAVLSAIAWFTLPRRGKDMIVVSNGKSDELFEKEIIPIVKDRAFFLDYEDRSNWSRWSLPVLLFRAFGPTPIPASFLSKCLPSVVQIRKFRLPRQFSFGPLITDKAINLRDFRSSLEGTVP
jgi:hypothetical protein